MNRILVAGSATSSRATTLLALKWRKSSQEDDACRCTVRDFGIRGIDLTYALLDSYDIAILIDTAQRGLSPGTISIIEPEKPSEADLGAQAALLEPHNLDPAKVLALVSALGGGCLRVILVACEPETFGDEELGAMGLSPAVSAAAGEAVSIVERLIGQLQKEMAQAEFNEWRITK